MLGNWHFLIVFLGLPLNFDKEKWSYIYIYIYIYIEQFLKKQYIFDFLSQFFDPNLKPSHKHFLCKMKPLLRLVFGM